MMVFEGATLNYPLPLRVAGNIVLPDTGSVTFTLYDHVGQVLFSSSPSTGSVLLNGTYHTIAAGRVFEKRTAVTTFNHQGANYLVRQTYRVTPFVNYSTTPDDVRNFIGISADELPDEAIDLFKAYAELAEGLPLATALNSGTLLELKANEAICMMAVIDVIPSLLQRLNYFEADGILQYRRQAVKDYSILEAAARNRLAELIADIGGDDFTPAAVTLLEMVKGTDVVTGEG